MKNIFVTNNAEETIDFAKSLGSRLKGDEVIELMSDVGGGKTTFVKGLARGAGSQDHVSSPTFTISKRYSTGKFDIFHFDFYRLGNAGVVKYEIEEAISVSAAVVVIEWSDIVQDVLPEERIRIHIKHVGENVRQLTIQLSAAQRYLLPD